MQRECPKHTLRISGSSDSMGVHTEVERLNTAIVPVYTVLSRILCRAIKRNVGRDRFEVKHEITDG